MNNLITKGIIGIQAKKESDVKCIWVSRNMRSDYMENYILPLLPTAELAHKLIDAGYTSGIYDKREIGATEILSTSSISLYSYADVNLDGTPKTPAQKVWWVDFEYDPGIHKWTRSIACDYVYLFVEEEAKWYRWNRHRGYIETRDDHKPRDFRAWDDTRPGVKYNVAVEHKVLESKDRKERHSYIEKVLFELADSTQSTYHDEKRRAS